MITHTDEAPAPIRLAKHLCFLLTSALYFHILEPHFTALNFGKGILNYNMCTIELHCSMQKLNEKRDRTLCMSEETYLSLL